jgi:hypothetical protein
MPGEIVMNHSLKGALLSAAVFPGVGQIGLKHYKRGVALMLTVFASLCLFVVIAVERALAILDRIQLDGEEVDVAAISNAATQASQDYTLKFFLFLIVLCWIVGVVDAYRIGRRKDLEERAASHRFQEKG